MLRRLLFPEPVRTLPCGRAFNIAFRTAHIAFTAVVVGGLVFQAGRERLSAWILLSLVTGIGLVAIEAYPSCRWFYQGRGIAVMAKLVLLCLIPLLWTYRLLILAVVIVIASVGSHMPGRFRYYSFLHRRMLK